MSGSHPNRGWEDEDWKPEPREAFSLEELKLASVILEELKRQEPNSYIAEGFEEKEVTVDGVFDFRVVARIILLYLK